MKLTLAIALLLPILLAACEPAPTSAPSAIPTAIPVTPTATAISLQKTYLSELEPASVTVGFWTLGIGTFPANDSGMAKGQPIRSSGRQYDHGLFAHASSSLVYELQGRYQTFSSDILLKDTACGHGAFFSVSLDNEEIYHSGVMIGADDPRPVELDVRGGNLLKLETIAGESDECDWTIWGDPFLMGDPLAPAVLPDPGKTAGAERLASIDAMTQVYIPAGSFLMGTLKDGDWVGEDELPQHQVFLSAYWMDKTEVTTAQYGKCMQDGGCTPPHSLASETFAKYFGEPDFSAYPVIQVDWAQADAYCRWAGRRLPTEAQWERAARGRLGRTFPWAGEGYGPDYANFGVDDNWPNADTTPIGSLPMGASPYGIYDMAGNVYEWVADWYAADFYQGSPAQDPTGPESGTGRVIRGGAWSSDWVFLRAASRLSFYPQDAANDIGFRCAQGE